MVKRSKVALLGVLLSYFQIYHCLVFVQSVRVNVHFCCVPNESQVVIEIFGAASEAEVCLNIVASHL